MPLIISGGLGHQTLDFSFLELINEDTTITLTFNIQPLLTGPAADPGNWLIDNEDGHAVEVEAVESSGFTVILTLSEQCDGSEYTLHIPQGLKNVYDHEFEGPWDYTFTGDGTNPVVLMTASIDQNTIQVSFSERVNEEDALDPDNYSIPGLTISSVSKVTDTTYRLTTSDQSVGASYTLTVTNVRDLRDNET